MEKRKRGWVIKNTRGLYLVKVVLPTTDLEKCLWSSRIQDAANWKDCDFAWGMADLWNISKEGYCSAIEVEVDEDGSAICATNRIRTQNGTMLDMKELN